MTNIVLWPLVVIADLGIRGYVSAPAPEFDQHSTIAEAIAPASSYRSIYRDGDGIDLSERNAFAHRVEIRAATAKVSRTRRVRTGVRGVLLPSNPSDRAFEVREPIVVLRGREIYAEFPETYRVSVRLLAPYEKETVTVRVTLSGGGSYFLERNVAFGAVASKTLHFDFDADEVTAPNRIAVNVLGGKRATFSVDLPRSRDPLD